MMVFTHINVAHYFYTNMKKQKENKFKINRWAFEFGSILPDISKMSNVKHHLDKTQEIYYKHIEIVNDKSQSNVQRSMALGVICHFLSDYFCMYHAKKPYNDYPLHLHFLYEFKLHLYIIYYLGKKNIINQHYLQNPHKRKDKTILEKDVKEEIELATLGSDRKKIIEGENHIDLASMLFSYHTKEESVVNDLDFTFFAINEMIYKLLGITVCEVTDYLLENENSIIGESLSKELDGKVVA